MTSISKNVYIDELDEIYIDFDKAIDDKDPKFKIDDILRMSKYKNIFAKGYVSIWSKKFWLLEKLNMLFHGYMLFVMLKWKKLLEYFTQKKFKLKK